MQEELDIPTAILRPKNRQSLGELLVEFFRYYVTFEWVWICQYHHLFQRASIILNQWNLNSFNQYAISVRLANKIPIEECRRVRSYKNDPHQWKYLCVEGKYILAYQWQRRNCILQPDSYIGNLCIHRTIWSNQHCKIGIRPRCVCKDQTCVRPHVPEFKGTSRSGQDIREGGFC